MEELGQAGGLYSVVVESCKSRWERAEKSQPPGSLMAQLFPNEMRAAADAAIQFDRPVILGDQDFNETMSRMKTVFVQSAKDIVSPPQGWSRLYSDVTRLVKGMAGSGADSFGPSDLLDPSLLSQAHVSISRYVLSILLKAPKVGVPVFALFIYSVVQSVADDMNASLASSGITDVNAELLSDTLLSLGFNLIQVALLGRVFLQALLQERNQILAENIYVECVKARQTANSSGEQVVVAVLGMAHCNGVKDILLSRGEQ